MNQIPNLYTIFTKKGQNLIYNYGQVWCVPQCRPPFGSMYVDVLWDKGEKTSAMSDPAFCLCINLTPATSFLNLGTHTAQRAHCPLTLEIQPLCEISRSCAPVGVVRDKNTYSFQHHIISGPQILFPCLLMGPAMKVSGGTNEPLQTKL